MSAPPCGPCCRSWLRTTYADLITALEETFLHRRTGGAEEMDTQAKVWL
ncbi:hypothetical protein ACIRPK_33795 [Kitasatospora sp. NPDC101801]